VIKLPNTTFDNISSSSEFAGNDRFWPMAES